MRSISSVAISMAMLIGVLVNPALASAQSTPTQIQHVVVIFGENISFDHYFGTYPKAANPPGQPRFVAAPNTPSVNGFNPGLLTNNPNLNPANGTGAANPFRLNRSQALTADMNHNYGPEQASFDHGLMDLFPTDTGTAGSSSSMSVLSPAVVTTKGLVMGYYDGNTVTALWEYAQHYALNDNSYNTQFGPSSPGAVNLISGQTNGINQGTVVNAASADETGDGQGGFTLIGDADPLNDVCAGSSKFQMNFTSANQNVGNLLTTAGISWGWFQGGFDLTVVNPNGTTGCSRSTVSPITGLTEADYVPHHEPFQFYPSTQNWAHTRPTSIATIGAAGDAGNHQYDLHDFFDALAAGNLPAVSFLKAQAFQNAHPGNSNPLDEQAFVVNAINTLEQSPFWSSTAVILAYDDSDGWYDHQMGPLVNGSFTTLDSLTGTSACGTQTATPNIPATPRLPGPNSNGAPVNGRCGYGVRTPLLVISPWAKPNYVDSTVTDQTSILRFIEDNWNLGRLGGGSFDSLANPITNMFNFTLTTPQNATPVILSPTTGLVQP
jgi:phospholipase C